MKKINLETSVAVSAAQANARSCSRVLEHPRQPAPDNPALSGNAFAPSRGRGDIAWRRVLLGSVAMGAAFVGYGRSVYAGPLDPSCSVSGSAVTCTGDLSDGVAVGDPYTTLNVNSLTANITPASGIIGLNLTGTGNNLTLNSNTGAFSITTVDAGADGIFVAAATSGVVDVHHSGDINAVNGAGIIARSDAGATTVNSSGRIDAQYAAIYARTVTSGDVSVSHTGDLSSVGSNSIRAVTFGLGDVTVSQAGDITATSGRGIEADSKSGDATVVSRGNIYARGAGIHANADGAGTASVTHTGDITSTNGEGIYSNSQAGSASIVSRGKITAASYGLYAIGHSGLVSVTHTGDIVASDAGIFAEGFGADVEVINNGDIEAGRSGIFAEAKTSGSVDVTHTGNITSALQEGIFAHTDNGDIKIVSSGKITALDPNVVNPGHGIYANAIMGSVSITHTGDITSTSRVGVYAQSGDSDVTIKTNGTIDAWEWGIVAKTSGTGAISITHTGDIFTGFVVGIYAASYDGGITINSNGKLETEDSGIMALSGGYGSVDVNHTGDITSRAFYGIVAYSYGSSVTVKSKGTIKSELDGIDAEAYGAVSVTHTGDITSAAGAGIFAYSYDSTVMVKSSGTIRSELDGIDAVAYGDVRVTHTGDIVTAGVGIYAFSDDSTVTVKSSGTIRSELDGIDAQAYGDVSVTHTGDIISTAGHGIYAYSYAGNVEISLGDGIVSGDEAIHAESASVSTLNLNAGSLIIGGIDLGAASVLNTGPGLSISHTFDGTVPVVGNTSGNVHAVNGNTIAVADISALDAADNQVSAMLDGVSGVLGGALARSAATDGGSVATAYAKTASPKSARSFDAVVTGAGAQSASRNNWWITPFGGFGMNFSTSSAPKSSQSFGGIVAGVDTLLDSGVRLGAFGGFVAARLDPRVTNGPETEATSYFAGVFGDYQADTYRFGFALTGGTSAHKGSRVIANNLAPGGFETALSEYNSFFIAPELTITAAPTMFGGTPMTPSLRMRYEANFSDGYTETGSSDGLSIGKGTSHAFNLRFQEAMPIALDDPAARLTFRSGIDARFVSQGSREATLIGVATSSAASTETSLGGFGGLDLIYALSESASLKASTELGLGSAGISATASLGIKVGF